MSQGDNTIKELTESNVCLAMVDQGPVSPAYVVEGRPTGKQTFLAKSHQMGLLFAPTQ